MAQRTQIAGLVLAAALTVAPAWAADTLRIGSAAPLLGFEGPLVAGNEQGIYRRAGLDIQLQQFGGAAKVHEAMAGDAADIALAGGTDFAFAIKGVPETVVASIVNEPNNTGLITDDPKIRSLDDLKGKRIGVTTMGGYTYWLAVELARVRGWRTNGIVPVAIGSSTASLVAALQTHQVDAAIGSVVIGMMLQDRGTGRVLTAASSYAPDVAPNIMFAQNSLIHDHPDVLCRFLAAWLDSLNWMLGHRDDGIAIGMKITGLPRETMTREYDIGLPSWSRDGRLSRKQLDATAAALVLSGLTQSKPDLTPYYTDAYLPR
jgi:NitT/TauT family transport system substrate-binding protein